MREDLDHGNDDDGDGDGDHDGDGVDQNEAWHDVPYRRVKYGP